MAYRRVDESVVHELLRRWWAGEGLRTIARATGLDRKTVRRYAKVADALRLAAASPVDEETVAAVVSVVHHSVDTVSETQHALASERERIRGWLALRVSLADVHARLALGGLGISYATLRRFAIEACGWRVRSRERNGVLPSSEAAMIWSAEVPMAWVPIGTSPPVSSDATRPVRFDPPDLSLVLSTPVMTQMSFLCLASGACDAPSVQELSVPTGFHAARFTPTGK